MKKILNRSRMIILENYLQKRLEEMNPAPATQEKNTNTAMDLYNKIIIVDINKIINPVM